MPRNKTAKASGWCVPCDKLSYDSRSAARSVAKEHHPHKQAYPCPFNDPEVAEQWNTEPNFFPLFHVGSLPRSIVQGHVTRDEYFTRGGGTA